MMARKVSQEAIFHNAFKDPKTMLQIARETNIERGHVCWFVFHASNDGTIFRLYHGLCPISKHRATFFTTDQETAIRHYYDITIHVWGKIDQLSQDHVKNVIREYVTNRFQIETRHVPSSIMGIWEKVKNIIDKERLL